MIQGSFTSKIIKGGALLDDTRRVVEAWDPSRSPAENLGHLRALDVLGKRSSVRAEDVLKRAIVPRLVTPGTQVIGALRLLLDDPGAFKAACYYESAREDCLLAAFAEGPVFDWWEAGRTEVRVAEVVDWLTRLGDGPNGRWSPGLKTRVAQGLLATLRDFGVLRGAVRKQIVDPQLGPVGFAYVAWREHERGASSRRLVSSRVWRRWLLDEASVLRHFSDLARRGVLKFSAAGSTVRVDWVAKGLEEVAIAAA